MKINIFFKAFFTMAFIVSCGMIYGQAHAAKPKSYKFPQDHSYFTFFLDNDLFAGMDENYSNGIRFSYITESHPVLDIPFLNNFIQGISGDKESPSWLRKIWGISNTEKTRYSHGFALTQLMYTPRDLYALEPPPGQRPYVGWLGLGLSIHVRNEKALNSVELTFGLTGKNSYAREAQDIVHDIRKFEKFQGWESQMPQEITADITFIQRRNLTDLKKVKLPIGIQLDGFYENGYSLGNFQTGIQGGLQFRIGWNLPEELSDSRLSLTAHTQKLFSNHNKDSTGYSLYSIFGFKAYAMFHDITLDGPVFRNYDTGVDKEWFVAELYTGVTIKAYNWEFGYVHVFSSKRFKSQDQRHAFGAVAIRAAF